MKCKTLIVLIAAFVVCTAQLPVYGQASSDMGALNNFTSRIGLSVEDVDKIKNLVDRRSEPIVKDVVISPEAPAENEPVSITATIVSPTYQFGDDIFEVYINYSTDGGKTIGRIAMEKETSDGNKWVGIIPGQPSKTNVVFGIQAVNAFDETYVETICETENAFEETVSSASDECEKNKNPGFCYATKPQGCMVPMSISSDKKEALWEDSNKIPLSLYIESTRAGFNKDKLFLEMDTKEDVSPGSYSPVEIHVYVVGWLNPDRGSRTETGIDAILKQGAIIIYAPLNTVDKCALYYLRGVTDVRKDSQSVTCNPEGKKLIFTVDRKAIEPNPSRNLEFAFMTLNMIQLSLSDIELEDLTLFTRVVFKNRSYLVQ